MSRFTSILAVLVVVLFAGISEAAPSNDLAPAQVQATAPKATASYQEARLLRPRSWFGGRGIPGLRRVRGLFGRC